MVGRTILFRRGIVILVAVSVATMTSCKRKQNTEHGSAEPLPVAIDDLPSYFLLPGYEKNLARDDHGLVTRVREGFSFVVYRSTEVLPPMEFVNGAKQHLTTLGWIGLDHSLEYPLDKCGSDAGWRRIPDGRKWEEWFLKGEEAINLLVIEPTNLENPSDWNLISHVVHYAPVATADLLARYRTVHPSADAPLDTHGATVQPGGATRVHEHDRSETGKTEKD